MATPSFKKHLAKAVLARGEHLQPRARVFLHAISLHRLDQSIHRTVQLRHVGPAWISLVAPRNPGWA